MRGWKSDDNWSKKEESGRTVAVVVLIRAQEWPEGEIDLHWWARHNHTQGHTQTKEQLCALFPWRTHFWFIPSWHPKRIESFKSLFPSALPAVCLLGISESIAALNTVSCQSCWSRRSSMKTEIQSKGLDKKWNTRLEISVNKLPCEVW